MGSNLEEFNTNSRPFKIYCNTLSSVDQSNNLIIESSSNNIELKTNNKNVIFNSNTLFNNNVNLNNKDIIGINKITASTIEVNNITGASLAAKNIVGGFVKSSVIGYNPGISGEKGSDSGRSDAYFTYIDVSGGDSSFNDSVYIKKNLNIDGSAIIANDLEVSGNIIASNFYDLSTNFYDLSTNFDASYSTIEFSAINTIDDPGNIGDIKFDISYLYIHVGTMWKRVQLETIT